MSRRHTLEDEDTSTEGDDFKIAKKNSNLKKINDVEDDTQSWSEKTDDDDEEESDDDESLPEVEPLAPNRARRSTAGNRMRELMGSAAAADEFYGSAYGGGFNEDDVEEFAPAGDSEEEEDEVDSDFDRSEEDEPAEEAAYENADAALRRQERQQLLAKNRKWAIARFNKQVVVENICDAKTQRQRLEEAKHTEQLNVASLKRFEEFELERRKRQLKPVQKTAPLGPIVSLISRASDNITNGGRILVVPDVRKFEPPAKREYRVCAVTGRPARYIDPLSGLAYADAAAFRQIRDSYAAYVRGQSEDDRELKGGTDNVNNGSEAMDTF